ncbi:MULTISPECIES: Gfo/Idh/MocA family oxidoreductase [Lactiplantibacillus]|uniref:Gfo/Idh/MocA family oxidoreductase n=1 Tax=Lactiplantibacillus TaxID=2767842 RepID=UPI00240E8D48|nr:Gfo/Idh/MocA family oxidoreductase [Lactiplantibacillus plantarum]MDG2545342.1 Gfo/Idh/MocA family oxidoreductase [Lactiplantibacillus plantarum]
MGVNNRTSNYQDILNNPDIDTVFIFTSTDTHEKMVTEAAEAKKISSVKNL